MSVFFAALVGVVAASSAPAAEEFAFPRPAILEPNINFWVDAFSTYSYRDFIIHDRENIQRVYEVMHLPGDGAPSRDEVEWANNYLKTKYSDILTRLGSGQTPSTWEESKVAELFQNEGPQAMLTAAQNLRVQQGMHERIRASLARAHYWLPQMEQLFVAAGLPGELSLLPIVESGFTSSARSSAGAVGMWQFTRSTGQQFLTISGRRDDRLHPMRATAGAVELLRYNFEVLGDWALAITAYNYGTYGMARAAATYGNDFTRILQSYDGRAFGFASKNYYAEFLAAVQIHRFENDYFPGISDEIAAPEPAPEVVEASYEPARRSSRSSSHNRHNRHRTTTASNVRVIRSHHVVPAVTHTKSHPVHRHLQRAIYHPKKSKPVKAA